MVNQNRLIWDSTMKKADEYGRVPNAVVLKDIPAMQFENNNDRVIKVFNEGLLNVAEKAAALGLKPLVINAGSDNDPLKPLGSGAIGAEWDLFRRSNIHVSLNNVELYPLRDDSIIYTPEVTVFRTEQFKIMKNPFEISVLTIPPLRRPGLVSERIGATIIDSYQNSFEEDRMRNSVEKIFQVALLKGHRCIVVDDFGCQKNCENPPDRVIKMFNNAIATYPVKYVFFAIIEPLLEKISRSKPCNIYKNYGEFDAKIIRKL
jgi:uncharacterized protein (TIGR02452 family)